MNHRAEQENLLAEVLAEASPADFRAALLAETLRLARRRRKLNQARRMAGVLTLAGLLVIFAIQKFSVPSASLRPLANNVAPRSYQLVRTQPLSIGALVRTRKLAVAQVFSPVPTVLKVSTFRGGFRLLNDRELLALLADKPAALVRTGPNSEELVFANPEDQKKFSIY